MFLNMALYKQVLKVLAITTVIGYVVTEKEDLSMLLGNPVIQQLMDRVSALETRDKIQQDRITQLELRETELESRDLTQQELITKLEAVVKEQQDQIKEMKRSMTVTSLNDKNLQEDLTDTNGEVKDTENDDLLKESTEDGKTEKRIRRQQTEVDNVAFTAILTTRKTDLGLDQTIVFDYVETNIANAYNPHHGVFVAPVAGTYVFHVSLHVQATLESWGNIVVNGVHKVGAYAHGGAHQSNQGSQSLVIRLNKGDDVAVEIGRAHDDVYSDVNHWSTFSGFLLRAEGDVTQIVG